MEVRLIYMRMYVFTKYIEKIVILRKYAQGKEKLAIEVRHKINILLELFTRKMIFLFCLSFFNGLGSQMILLKLFKRFIKSIIKVFLIGHFFPFHKTEISNTFLKDQQLSFCNNFHKEKGKIISDRTNIKHHFILFQIKNKNSE